MCLKIIIFTIICFATKLHLVSGLYISDLLGSNKYQYYNYTELTDFLKTCEKQYPDIIKVKSIGKSVEQRDIWAVEISHNVQKERKLLKPMFKYVANMHGDETVGAELTVFLLQFLIKSDQNKDTRIWRLLDTTDIYLVPTMNPDGYSKAQEGNCESNGDWTGRRNANNVDLNRDFPDQFDEKDDKKVRQPETTAIKNFILFNPFVLSGNLHGGALVVSYPFDSHPYGILTGVYSRTPDDTLFIELAKSYANQHPLIPKKRSCGQEDFKGGITNGNYWYKVPGGMQDYNYVYSNCFEITMELSCCKFPRTRELFTYWTNNKASLLNFMEQVHLGISGIVRDSRGNPIPKAKIIVRGNRKHIKTTVRGEYWRLLLPGTYEVTVKADGFGNQPFITVNVEKNRNQRIDFVLK